jgi:hypothetical protein
LRVPGDLLRFTISGGIAVCFPWFFRWDPAKGNRGIDRQKLEQRYRQLQRRDAVLILLRQSDGFRLPASKAAWTSLLAAV